MTAYERDVNTCAKCDIKETIVYIKGISDSRATASKFGFKQHIGQIVVGKARFEAPFL